MGRTKSGSTTCTSVAGVYIFKIRGGGGRVHGFSFAGIRSHLLSHLPHWGTNWAVWWRIKDGGGCAQLHTVQPLFLSEGAKRRQFYHITVILQYCLDKTIAQSGDIYKDDSGTLNLVINISASQTLRCKISLFEFPLLKLHLSVWGILKFLWTKFKNIHVSSLLISSLHAIVINNIVKNTSDLLWYRLKSFLHLHL